MPPDFLHDRWETMRGAGVGIAHGDVIAVDIDTDDPEVERAVYSVLPGSPCRRRGKKGHAGYYRISDELRDQSARMRWYRPDSDTPVIELLFSGTQTVLPPTVHPDTGQPYHWITPDSLESTDPEDLPVLTKDILHALAQAMTEIHLVKRLPKKVNAKAYDRPALTSHDLEKPFGRSLNDRAMEPAAIDQWWPALSMPGTNQRGPGAWEAIPFWRPSSSGRAISERNPNLKIVPDGIVDFGADQSYTPADLVSAALNISFSEAASWLSSYIRPETIFRDVPDAPQTPPAPDVDLTQWSTTPRLLGDVAAHPVKPRKLPTEAEFEALVPSEPQPFPIQSPRSVLRGILGHTTAWIEDASVVRSEAGALAVSLPLLGALMGRLYQSPTGLRTNVYTVAIGVSGAGKSALVGPAKELLVACDRSCLGNDTIASGSGLLAMLTGHPRRVCFLDEFGHMLQQISAPGAGVHARQILTEFTRLYSDANKLYTGTAYATREAEPIDSPHLCVFGMATPEQFWSAFGSHSLSDGTVPRYLVMPLGDTELKEPNPAGMEDLVQEIAEISVASQGRVTGNLGRPEVLTVPLTELADKAYWSLRRTMGAMADYADHNGIKGAGPILRRVAENAVKIALISAVGRDPVGAEISDYDFEIGHALARWSAQTMIINIASFIADNQTERDVNEVERFIRDGGETGRAQRQLLRKFRRIKKREMTDILEGLEREGTVQTIRSIPESGGTPSIIYLANR